MSIKKALSTTFLFFFFSISIFAQTQKISGRITDATSGSPLEGVSVKVKSTNHGASTSKDGSFTVDATSSDELEITAVGYTTQTVHVSGSPIEIKLVQSVNELSEIVMVGSRSGGRVKTESPVPVDVINLAQATQTTGKTDLTSLLNMMAPSFNYNKQSGGDGADAVDLATLRGLGPDQTLVLINGKRQHQTAFVALFGTRGRGNSGTDLNAIPESAIDHVEILRDGAAAQYGSDAIAGVINIVLKKNVDHLTMNAGYSGYYDHKYNALNSVAPNEYYTGSQIDGNTFTFGINDGFSIGKRGGYLNLSGDFLKQGKTFREAPDTNVTTNSNALPLNTGRRAFGDASVTSGGAMLNSEIPVGKGSTKFYAFGGYNYKNSNAYAYTRNYSGAPQKFPTNSDGSLLFFPDIMFYTDPSNPSAGDIYYDPIEDVHITDASLGVGFKGAFGNDWTWDVSNVAGGNNFHYFGDKTFNASEVANGVVQTHFDDGGFSLFQNTTNADFNKHFANIASGMNLSIGTEFRYEKYHIYAGEEASYATYNDNFAGGAQGFPGFQPADEVSATRTNLAAYVEDELNISKSFLIDGAVRAENYSDFGFIATYKFATRYKLTHNFNLRGSVSTGFRAPSLQQIDFSNTETNVEAGVATQVKIAPNYSPITAAAGIPALKPEKSVNASIGFAWKPFSNFSITVDGYMVKVKDRVVLTGEFDTTNLNLAPILKELHVDDVQFFANAVNTTNYGLDIVFDYKKHFGRNTFSALLAGNFQNLTIDKINVPAALNDNATDAENFFSIREQAFVKASAPPQKVNLNLEYDINKFGVGTHFTYYGKILLYGYGLEPYNYNGKMVSDLYFSYKLAKPATFYIGADNIFNVHPNYAVIPGQPGSAYDNETGGAWDAVQMGFNGTRLFAKLAINL